MAGKIHKKQKITKYTNTHENVVIDISLLSWDKICLNGKFIKVLTFSVTLGKLNVQLPADEPSTIQRIHGIFGITYILKCAGKC